MDVVPRSGTDNLETKILRHGFFFRLPVAPRFHCSLGHTPYYYVVVLRSTSSTRSSSHTYSMGLRIWPGPIDQPAR